MAYTLLGRIRPVYRGAWSSAESYTVLEMVKSADGRAAYIALKDVPKGIPVTNTSYWGMVLDVGKVLDAADAAISEAVGRADEAAGRADAAAERAPLPLVLTEKASPALIWPDAGSAVRPAVHVKPVQSGSGDPHPAGAGNQLYDVSTMFSTSPNVDSDDWITCDLDNSSGSEVSYVNAYTRASALIGAGKVYTVVCEVKEISGKLHAVNASTASSVGQFTTNVTITSVGTHIDQITARDDFNGCTTMLRTTLAVDPYTRGRCVFRLTVIEGAIDGSDFVYTPFENIRPITGRASASVTRCGRNMIDAANASRLTGDTLLEPSDGGLRIYTTANGTWLGASYGNFHVSAGVTVTGSIDVTEYVSGELRFGLRRADTNAFVSGSAVASANGHYSFSFKPSEDMRVFPSILITNATASSGDITVANVQIEVGDETEYEPYRGDTFSRSFGRTVYGGTLDADSGMLTITHVFVPLTGTEALTSYTGSDGLTYYRLTNLCGDRPAKNKSALVCSHYPTTNSVHSGTQGVIFNDSCMTVMLRDSRFQNTPDVDGMKAYFAAQYAAGTPVQICYEVAQPETVQLSPLEIPALEGVNTVFTGADGLSVTYNKSLVREHEELMARLAALESAVVNNV